MAETSHDLLWYFDHDVHPGNRIDTTFDLEGATAGIPKLPVRLRGYQDFSSNSKYLACFVPQDQHAADACLTLLRSIPTLLTVFDGIRAILSHPTGNDPPRSSDDLQFTGRIFLYVDVTLEPSQRERIAEVAAENSAFAHVRDATYAALRATNEKPDAFICHDSRDKEALARPLAESLRKRGIILWYDEYSLKIGDSLRESIERGLRACRRCIVLLSKNFISNGGWTKVEFNSIFTREILEKEALVLPIWHEVSADDVYSYSPSLLNRVAGTSAEGIDSLTVKLVTVLRK